MEKALFVEDPQRLLQLRSQLSEFARIYFGEEYCGRRLPSEHQLHQILEICLEMEKKLTFLTPIVTMQELIRLTEIIKIILHTSEEYRRLQLEIVFNDLGFFDTLRYSGGFTPVLGHLLVRQKRDPGFLFLNVHDPRLTKNELRHIRSSNIDSNPWIKEFVQENFARVELVNTAQGSDLSLALPRSLYLPLVPVTVTRYCKWAAMEAGEANASDYFECTRPCLTQYAEHTRKGIKIYLYGNTQFYVNNTIINPHKGIDRIVHYSFSHFPQDPH